MSFITSLYHHQSDLWVLKHKVTFDPITRLIYVNAGVTSLDVKIDLYSDMKEWMGLAQRDNTKYRPPIRVIGGDPTTAGQTAGDIYFMKEGWRVVYDPTQTSITGVLFSDDYDTPWLYSETLEPVYPAQVSSLVTAVQPTLEGLAIPTAQENATAVNTIWAGLTPQELLTIKKFIGLK